MPGPMQHAAMLLRRARFYFNRARFERDLAEEMRFHVEMKARDHQQAGMSASDARAAARRRFGNTARLQEETGDIMAIRWVDGALQDARYALRSLRKSPGFSAVAITSLALGIGATTAVFTLVNAMLIRPLPFPEANRLVVTFQTTTPGVLFSADSMPWTYERFVRVRASVPAFADAAFSKWEEYNLRRTGIAPGAMATTARVRAELVTSNLFSVLGARPLLGRTITAADSVVSSGSAVAVLSEPLWRREFGADSGVIGATAVLDQLPVTIVGVMPASFTGIRESVEMWVPLKAIALLNSPRNRDRPEGGMGTVVARLRPGASIAVADAQVKAAAPAVNAEFPVRFFGSRKSVWSGGVVSLAAARQHQLIRPLLVVLSIAVASVMLIVCANIAGLLLARARARESEMGVRIALGAGRGRLARQVLTESMVLAVLGGLPAILLAYGGAALLARLRPELQPNYVLLRSVDLLQGQSLAPDWRVLTFVLLLTVIVGLVFGAAPALAASRTSIAELIKVAGSRGGTSRANGRRALVIGQVALATTLLVGAGLMVRSFRALLRSDIGFVPEGMVKLELSGGDSTLATPARQEAVLARIAALPGMESAASYSCAPLGGNCFLMPVAQLDQRILERDEYPPIEVHIVSRDFLRAMQTPLRLGRSFDSREASGRVTAALVNEAAARLLWRGESPIGRRLSTFRDSTPPVEVVGVVADVKYEAIDAPVRPAIYYEMGQWGGRTSVIVARTRARDAASAVVEIRRVILENDPTVAVHRVATGDEMLARAASSTRFVAALLSAFGVGAALLAALGVYGVLAYLVSQRKREFGIRMAIGAQASSVTALVVKQGVVLTAVGLVVGVGGAIAATGVLSTFLFGVPRADVLTYAVIILLVGAAGILAAWIPARRATRVDPVMALRE
jgi:putative ABC transport system permease protein